MAGDWIKMRVDLAHDPAVIGIAARVDLDEDHVVGKLHRLWSWADQQTTDGNAPGVTEKWVDRYLCVAGFAAAMVEVGWMVVTERGIALPDFSKHNGQTGKRRALTSKRVAAHRNAASVTKALPEKRREEKRRYKKDPPLSPLDQISYPSGWDTEAIRKAVQDWIDYKRRKGKPYKDPAGQISRLLRAERFGGDSAVFIQAVDHSIASNYDGCFAPGDANAQSRNEQAGSGVATRGRIRTGKYAYLDSEETGLSPACQADGPASQGGLGPLFPDGGTGPA